ncbi:Wall-associated receptor kinase 5 [Forsythia ovata]|uniref:Wall-associated receptor kinase 5 n=1 Tax=Forsythia ovata TaxID=205694 RepID=A0ABD1QCB6_9LAMI
MAPQRMLVRIMYSALLFALHFQDTTALTKNPHCQNKCGNLTIPYPFGIGEKCYLAERFAVTCNHSTNSAYLDFFDSQVFNISESDVHINGFPVLPLKFNKSSGENLLIEYAEATWGPYFILPRARNKLVVVACYAYAYIVDSKTKNLVTGCATFCNRTDIAPSSSSSCAGIHCCQTSIPKDISDFTLRVHSMNTDKKSWASYDCNAFFIADKDFNGFDKPTNFSNCGKDDIIKYSAPVILEWAVGNTSCKNASKIKGYACRENSDCVDAAGGGAYRCRCKRGYKGNPYIKQGCKDVNECTSKDKNVCPEKTVCVNTIGSYDCEIEPRKQSFMPIYLGTALAISFLILVAVCLWLTREHKKRMDKKSKQKFFKRNGGLLLQHHISSTRGSAPQTKLFVREDLKKATDNFNENRILGKGGLGTVYKGMLSDGSVIAVKKSNIVDKNQVDQFINEVFILSQISHRHIVKLLGCCLETEVPLLVYEYISNGTLYHHLHDEPNISTISWENRLRVAVEVAGALSYLHSCVTTAIFHRDIKSSNILLDENYRAVVSDFGLSRSVPIDKTHLTTLVGGTFGYLDPEYFRSGQLNDKSDVYAFGVVLAELLTGQQAVSSKTDVGLVLRFRSAIKENSLFGILEKRIATEGPEEEILAVAKHAKRCLKLTARKRPCMKEVAAELDGLTRIKEHKICKQTSRDTCCSISDRSFSWTNETLGEDDEDI